MSGTHSREPVRPERRLMADSRRQRGSASWTRSAPRRGWTVRQLRAGSKDSCGSACAGRARDLTAGKLTAKLSYRKADIHGRQWTTPCRRRLGARTDRIPDGVAGDRCCQRSGIALAHVLRLHYDLLMKTAVIPQVRVEPGLRADLDSVLLPGETLTEFVEASVRRAVEYRRVQTDFAARCEASLAAYERSGTSIPSEVVLKKLEARVAARVKQLRK